MGDNQDNQKGTLLSAVPWSPLVPQLWGRGWLGRCCREPRAHPARGRALLQHLLGVCLSFIPIPALPPPPLSSLHLHRPKNRARLCLCLISLSGSWYDPICGDRTHQCPSDATFLTQMLSGCSALGTFPCSQPKMLNPGHGLSPCMAPLLHLGWGWHQLQRCPCGRGRAEMCPQPPSSYSPQKCLE